MDIVKNLYETIGYVMNYPMNLFGYSVSIMQMFIFTCLVGICGYFLVKFLFW